MGTSLDTSSSKLACFTKRGFVSNAKIELKFMKTLLPLLLYFITGYTLAFITLLFAGRIDDDHMAGIGLAITVFNVFMMSIMWGYCSVFDTYGPPVYSSTQKKEFGTVMMKCFAQGLLIFLIILGPYLNTSYILANVPQLSHTSSSQSYQGNKGMSVQHITIRYLRLTCVVGFFDYLLDLFSKYLAIQGYSKFVFSTSLAQLVFHVLFNYLLVTVNHLGVDGLAYATILGRLATLAMIFIFFVINRNHLILPTVSKKIFEDWKPMMKLGISGSINMIAELALYEIASFLSQYNGIATLSTIIIMFQLQNAAASITMAMSYAIAVLIGEKLGERDEKGVWTYIKCGIWNTVLDSIILLSISYFFQDYIVRMFTIAPDVINMFKSCIWLFILRIPIDNLQFIISRGILIAFGKQHFIAISLSIASYGVGLPILIYTIFFTDMKATGILLAFVMFVSLQLVIVLIKMKYISIADEINHAEDRVGCTAELLNENKSDNTSQLLTENKSDDTEKSCTGTITQSKLSDPGNWKYILLAFIISAISCSILSGISMYAD